MEKVSKKYRGLRITERQKNRSDSQLANTVLQRCPLLSQVPHITRNTSEIIR